MRLSSYYSILPGLTGMLFSSLAIHQLHASPFDPLKNISRQNYTATVSQNADFGSSEKRFNSTISSTANSNFVTFRSYNSPRTKVQNYRQAQQQVSYRDGSGAWNLRNSIVQNGLSQLGKRYIWGASDPNRGFDCSGFTRYVLGKSGVQLPRTAAEQMRASRSVSGRPLMAGDMVFFKTGRNHHVGIMIDSNRFVHASTSQKRIIVANLDESYWQRRLLKKGTFVNN